MSARLTLLCAALVMTGTARAQMNPPARPASDDKTVELERVEVTATSEDEGYDATGMGSVEEEMRDEPFGNDLISAADFTPDADSLALAGQIAAIAEASPADRIAGQDRLNLRGFPTPTLRNSFIQVGVPEVLNTGQTIVIQGPLVPVLGRAAPGGIQNFISARPRTKPQLRLAASASNRGRTRASLEWTGPVVPKKNWQRLAAEWTHRTGPEQFAEEDTFAASAALTFRHSRTASTMIEFDYRRIDALASPGVPEFIPVGATKSAGPWRPLALFNANGPEATVRRESLYGGVQFDTQPIKGLALRASLGAWRRELEQERFTTSRLDLATGFFAGTREPRHLEQPQQAFIAQLEGTLRYRKFGAEHKLLAAASHTWGRYLRAERALTAADRNRLPSDVLHFNPAAPNYFRPPFSPELYRRVITDRLERARYGSVEVSDRAAWKNGLTVLTAGLRYDTVALEIEDRRPNAARPHTDDRTSQWSGHLGVNHQVRRGRLLAFASTSSAFDPSTPVDARTGRIQDNETTVGHEAGLKGRLGRGRLDWSASAFLLFNRNIARGNPLYNDPVADANQTQPQLVATGEERFSGARVELNWKPRPDTTVVFKGSQVRAVTTASPDLPQEVDRPLTRLPEYTLSTSVRYRTPDPAGGLNWNVGWQYVSGFVANYEDARRSFLAYPGYGLVHAGAGWSWRRKNRQIEIELNVRNLLGRDLLASHARPGAGRELVFAARASF